MGKKLARAEELLRIIEKRGTVSIKTLAMLANVSELTIRRDIRSMEEQNLVRNIRGTVFFNGQDLDDNYLLSVATTQHSKEKNAIGAYAASLIKPGELVIIDNGSTTEKLAAHIPPSMEATVLCYNMNVLNNLYRKPKISLIFCGGYFHSQTLMFECQESLEIIKRTRANKVFVSAAGVHEMLGVTCVSEYELANKREIIKAGAERILLIDSSKFGVITPCFVSEITSFEVIVTDRGIPPHWVDYVRDKGIKLVVV